MAASYFDVDGTLVSSNLIPPTLYYLLNLPTPVHVMQNLGRAIIKAPAMAWAEYRDRRLFNEVLFTVFDGMSEDRLVTLADDVFDRVLRPKLYPGARDLVQTSLCDRWSRAPTRPSSCAITRAPTATISTSASPTRTATPTCPCSPSSATRWR
jgi:hypothetical protein